MVSRDRKALRTNGKTCCGSDIGYSIIVLVKTQNWGFDARIELTGQKTKTKGQHFNFTLFNHKDHSHVIAKHNYVQARELMHTHADTTHPPMCTVSISMEKELN